MDLNTLDNNVDYTIPKVLSDHIEKVGLIVGNPIASGAFGKVYKSIHVTENGEKEYAIKVLNFNRSQKLAVQAEINTNVKLKTSEYIASYFMGKVFTEWAYIAVEYIDGVTLDNVIVDEMPIDNMYSIIKQLILGLEYIHSMGVAHLDIKPLNIMLSNDGAIKFIDFGLAINDDMVDVLNKFRGTIYYCAPELFLDIDINGISNLQKCDVWSVGAVIYELTHGFGNVPIRADGTNLILAKRSARKIINSGWTDDINDTSKIILPHTADENTNALLAFLLVVTPDSRPAVGMAVGSFPAFFV